MLAATKQLTCTCVILIFPKNRPGSLEFDLQGYQDKYHVQMPLGIRKTFFKTLKVRFLNMLSVVITKGQM